MAIGDDATAAGYAIVPGTGEEGKVKYGAREINRTRDYLAQLKNAITTVALGGTGASTKTGARTNLGITSGTATPSSSDGSDGDIYFKII